jgi:hypothetical protein
VNSIFGVYEATLAEDGTSMTGKWKQGGAELPLTLKRVKKVAEPKRPQEPMKPYPYREEEVTYENKAGGSRLAGTLTLPRGSGPFPATLLITGSGSQDRDETVMGHRPFLILADALTRRGIAVLRVDDRGVTIREFPKLNHLFQTSRTGSPAEYGQIEETFSPTALKAIGDWAIQHTRKR